MTLRFVDENALRVRLDSFGHVALFGFVVCRIIPNCLVRPLDCYPFLIDFTTSKMPGQISPVRYSVLISLGVRVGLGFAWRHITHSLV